MRGTKLIKQIPGLTLDHLHNWERQGYLSPKRITIGKKQVRDYSKDDISIIKSMWFYYRQGMSPQNAYKNTIANKLSANEISKTCPFCNETDFDLYGLQLHLQNSWCSVYGNIKDQRHEKD